MPSPYYASVILSLAGVVCESLSFSTLQKMQGWLQQDSNPRLEATYCHSLIRRHAQNDHGHRGRLYIKTNALEGVTTEGFPIYNLLQLSLKEA